MIAAAQSRRRIVVLAGLWAVAALLFVGHALWMKSLADANRAVIGGPIFVVAEQWRAVGIVLPRLLAVTALVLQFRWYPGDWRILTGLVAALLVPILLITLLIAWERGPRRLDSVPLRSGRLYMLTIELAGFDPVYSLYESAGPAALYWRHIAYLESPDGRFGDRERIAVSSDGRWLVVGRGGMWSCCLRLARGQLLDCPQRVMQRAASVSDEAEMHLRSRRITALTGLAP